MKKILAILFSTLLVLTVFASCKANKSDETLTPNPPTGTTESEEIIETTKNEVVPETEKKEENPETTTKKTVVTKAPVSDPTKPVVTKSPKQNLSRFLLVQQKIEQMPPQLLSQF